MIFNKHMKFKTAIIVVFFSFWLVGSTILGTVFYRLLSNYVDNETRNHLRELAGHASMIINADDHARLRTAGDAKDSIFIGIVQKLRVFRDISKNLAYIYTARLVNDKVMFIVDAEEDSTKVSNFGDIYDDATELLSNLVRECNAPAVEKNYHSDQWGTFLTGYAPLMTSDGKLDGVVCIDLSMQTVDKLKQQILFWIISIILLLLLVAFFIAVSFAKSISDPITTIDSALDRIAAGDLNKTDTNNRYKYRLNEIGSLFRSKEKLQESFTNFLTNINKTVVTLVSSARTLSDASTLMASNAEETNTQTSEASSATEQATTNINTISSAAQEMSSSANSVATAIEEMSASLNEVSRNCQKELQIAAEANDHAKNSKDVMDRLGAAAKSIGKVVDVINDIADQTNLLALNASIEAASAGNAGKGFAVVANEVKELAKQTAQATQEIQKQVEDMQANTISAVKAIESVSRVIDEVNVISQTIVSAVEQQNATVSEISRNVSGVSTGAQEVSKNVAESATRLSKVSSTIACVNNAVTDTAKGIVQVKTSAGELSKLSEGLEELLRQFKI